MRRVKESTKSKLRIRASRHGRSMEEEVRQILDAAAAVEDGRTGLDLVNAIRKRFEPLGWLELPEIRREPMRPPPDLGE